MHGSTAGGEERSPAETVVVAVQRKKVNNGRGK